MCLHQQCNWCVIYYQCSWCAANVLTSALSQVSQSAGTTTANVKNLHRRQLQPHCCRNYNPEEFSVMTVPLRRIAASFCISGPPSSTDQAGTLTSSDQRLLGLEWRIMASHLVSAQHHWYFLQLQYPTVDNVVEKCLMDHSVCQRLPDNRKTSLSGHAGLPQKLKAHYKSLPSLVYRRTLLPWKFIKLSHTLNSSWVARP